MLVRRTRYSRVGDNSALPSLVAYTHTCAAFAGAFLLRFARLFPGDVNMEETTQQVDTLANILSEGKS